MYNESENYESDDRKQRLSRYLFNDFFHFLLVGSTRVSEIVIGEVGRDADRGLFSLTEAGDPPFVDLTSS